MRPKLVMTPLAQYEPVKWSGVNESGIRPINDYVLVLPDQAAGRTAGGVFIDDITADRNTQAAETGVLVEIGEGAWIWNSDRSRPYGGSKPEVGQRVWFERYAGSLQHGKDGRVYRLMQDKCVGAVAE